MAIEIKEIIIRTELDYDSEEKDQSIPSNGEVA